MNRAAIVLLGLVFCGAATAADLAPGAIYTHTARIGVTITTGDEKGAPGPLAPGTIFAAHGQILNVPAGLAAALILSNGNTLYLPEGGRLTFDEFGQEPLTATDRDRDYEPTRSSVRLELAEGLLVITGRNQVPTSTFTVNTPFAQIVSHAKSLAVRVNRDGVTITVLDGTAEVTALGAQSHDAVQAGQTATITRQSLHAAYPLQFTTTTTDTSEHFGIFANSARHIESEATFNGIRQHFQVTLRIPVDHTLQLSADDPRFR